MSAILDTQIREHVDIASPAEIFTYHYAGVTPREVIVRVYLGDDDFGSITGGSVYTLSLYIDGTRLSPDSCVEVPIGATETLMISRQVPLLPDSVLEARVVGLMTDFSVYVKTVLHDVTPLRASELIGSGAVLVDHNYGGVDKLAVETASGARVDNVTIRSYLATDWHSGRRALEFVVAAIQTDVRGQWRQPMMLDPESYVLFVFRQGVIRPEVVPITVEAE